VAQIVGGIQFFWDYLLFLSALAGSRFLPAVNEKSGGPERAPRFPEKSGAGSAARPQLWRIGHRRSNCSPAPEHRALVEIRSPQRSCPTRRTFEPHLRHEKRLAGRSGISAFRVRSGPEMCRQPNSTARYRSAPMAMTQLA